MHCLYVLLASATISTLVGTIERESFQEPKSFRVIEADGELDVIGVNGASLRSLLPPEVDVKFKEGIVITNADHLYVPSRNSLSETDVVFASFMAGGLFDDLRQEKLKYIKTVGMSSAFCVHFEDRVLGNVEVHNLISTMADVSFLQGRNVAVGLGVQKARYELIADALKKQEQYASLNDMRGLFIPENVQEESPKMWEREVGVYKPDVSKIEDVSIAELKELADGATSQKRLWETMLAYTVIRRD